jgi:pimeloyl-ACP methyl ester carboxylesterase
VTKGVNPTIRWILLLIGAVMLGLGLQVGTGEGIAVEPFSLDLSPGQTLVGTVYRPVTAAPTPAVLLCHGISSSQQTLAPLARELARWGIAGVVFDFGGYGQSYRRPIDGAASRVDATALLQWMRQQPQFDPERLGILGHSMGGTTALELAQVNADIQATVILSIAGFATPTSPKNLLFVSGVYEELNPVAEMVDFFADATPTPTPPFTQVGAFDQGTARQLVFAPGADHVVAPFDGTVHRAVGQWLVQAFRLPGGAADLAAQRWIWGWGLISFGSLGLAGMGYGHLLQRWPLGRLGVGLGLCLGLVLGRSGGGFGLALAGVLVLGLGNSCDRNPVMFRRTSRQLGLYGLLVFGLLLIAIATNALITGSLIAQPQAILSFPILAKNLTMPVLYDRAHSLSYALNSAWGLGLMVGVISLELLKPGMTYRTLDQLLRLSLTRCRQPLQWRTAKIDKRSLGLVLALGVLWIGVMVWQSQTGRWGQEMLPFAGRLLGVFVLWPLGLGLMIVRSPRFQQLERRWAGE